MTNRPILSYLTASFGICTYFNKNQFTAYSFIPNKVFHFDYINELIQLLDALIQCFFIAIKGNCNTRSAIFMSRTDI